MKIIIINNNKVDVISFQHYHHTQQSRISYDAITLYLVLDPESALKIHLIKKQNHRPVATCALVPLVERHMTTHCQANSLLNSDATCLLKAACSRVLSGRSTDSDGFLEIIIFLANSLSLCVKFCLCLCPRECPQVARIQNRTESVLTKHVCLQRPLLSGEQKLYLSPQTGRSPL